MGVGRAKGENRVIEAVRQAVSSPLLETTIEGAKSVILNVTGGKDLMLSEVNEAAVLIQGIIDLSANIIFGATIDDKMVDEVKITVIATGFPMNTEPERIKPVEVKPVINVVPAEKPVENEDLPLVKASKENEDKPVVDTPVKKEEKVETPVETVETTEKGGRELPAFMKKLFGRK
jgi:cell division GTPase FtsZ